MTIVAPLLGVLVVIVLCLIGQVLNEIRWELQAMNNLRRLYHETRPDR